MEKDATKQNRTHIIIGNEEGEERQATTTTTTTLKEKDLLLGVHRRKQNIQSENNINIDKYELMIVLERHKYEMNYTHHHLRFIYANLCNFVMPEYVLEILTFPTFCFVLIKFHRFFNVHSTSWIEQCNKQYLIGVICFEQINPSLSVLLVSN